MVDSDESEILLLHCQKTHIATITVLQPASYKAYVPSKALQKYYFSNSSKVAKVRCLYVLSFKIVPGYKTFKLFVKNFLMTQQKRKSCLDVNRKNDRGCVSRILSFIICPKKILKLTNFLKMVNVTSLDANGSMNNTLTLMPR